jgi:hypothetical protein
MLITLLDFNYLDCSIKWNIERDIFIVTHNFIDDNGSNLSITIY